MQRHVIEKATNVTGVECRFGYMTPLKARANELPKRLLVWSAEHHEISERHLFLLAGHAFWKPIFGSLSSAKVDDLVLQSRPAKSSFVSQLCFKRPHPRLHCHTLPRCCCRHGLLLEQKPTEKKTITARRRGGVANRMNALMFRRRAGVPLDSYNLLVGGFNNGRVERDTFCRRDVSIIRSY